MILRWKKGAVNQPHRYFTIWRHDFGVGVVILVSGRLLVVLAGKGPGAVFEGKGPSIAFTGKRAGADFT